MAALRKLQTATGRAKKGSASVESFQGRLRVRFRYEGQQKVVSLGLPDNIENRKKAELTARQIEVDISSGEFDTSLSKYKPKKQQNQQTLLKTDITITELFQACIDHKSQ